MQTSYEPKQHPASTKRRQRARSQGHYPQSQYLPTATVLVAATISLLLLGDPLLGKLQELTQQQLGNGPRISVTTDLPAYFLRTTAFYLLPVLLPFLGVVFLVALLVHAGQIGITPLAHRITPNYARIDPTQGIQRLLSLENLLRFGSGLLQVGVILVVAWTCLSPLLDNNLFHADDQPREIATRIGGFLANSALKIGLALLASAGIDYAVQRWKFERELRMTSRELREETRRDEVNPRIKQTRQQRQRARSAETAEASDTPQLQAILTHESGLVVTLGSPEPPSTAPRVVQKEVGRRADRIRRAARKAKVPVVEQSKLAQFLLQHVPSGMPVPPEQSDQINALLRARSAFHS
ncbi:MAG: hypothetical protein CMJ75_20915 [Planctomycetaceae bacterium]|nr:hypothetical protein [Planctomycetaceae bacterium]